MAKAEGVHDGAPLGLRRSLIPAHDHSRPAPACLENFRIADVAAQRLDRAVPRLVHHLENRGAARWARECAQPARGCRATDARSRSRGADHEDGAAGDQPVLKPSALFIAKVLQHDTPIVAHTSGIRRFWRCLLGADTSVVTTHRFAGVASA
jgi:hypothetical protein